MIQEVIAMNIICPCRRTSWPTHKAEKCSTADTGRLRGRGWMRLGRHHGEEFSVSVIRVLLTMAIFKTSNAPFGKIITCSIVSIE
jgi:hypothetical protein